MRLTDIISINIKKLKTRTNKALFLIIPVIALITLSVVVTSQVDNIRNAMKVSVFNTIADQYTLLKVQVERQDFNPNQMFKNSGSVEQNRYSQSDVSTVNNISGVKSAALETSIPVSQASSTDLFTNKTLKFNNLMTLDPQAAKLYTNNDFSYTQGQPIPIILNASSLVYTYEDWSQGNSIKLEMPKMNEIRNQPGETAKRISFLKTESLQYNKDELIGKEFTISFGGLDPITDYTISRDNGEVTMTKLSSSALAAKVNDRKTAISQYWNYTKISAPKTYTFKIVGIIEDQSSNANTATYVPADFADTVIHDLINNEISARKTADLPNSILNSDFTGLTYNGDELTQSIGGFLGQIGKRVMIRMGEGKPGATFSTSDALNGVNGTAIPGLVVQTNDSNEVVGEMNNADIYKISNKYGDTMSVVLNSITDRADVVRALNKAGYAYQDLSDLDVFVKLENNLTAISNGLLISFIVLLAVTIVFTMSKYVSESTKEIGIFRAIGMKSSTVLALFISQSILYVAIGYITGLLLGLGLNLVSSGFVSTWFSKFIKDTVSQSFNVVQKANPSIFNGINWSSIIMYTVILFAITLVVSIIPSYTASKISPVEAIKNE